MAERRGRRMSVPAILDGGRLRIIEGRLCETAQRVVWRGPGTLLSDEYRAGEQACFPFPFPFDPIGSREGQRSACELIAAGRGLYDTAICDELRKCLTDIAGAHAHGIANLLLRERRRGVGEDLFDALQARRQSGGCGRWRLVDGLEGQRWGVGFEDERHAVDALGRAM